MSMSIFFNTLKPGSQGKLRTAQESAAEQDAAPEVAMAEAASG